MNNVRNQMLWLTGAPLLVAFAISTVLGAPGLLFFAGQCVVAFTLLEAVNYVEHYGLLRGRTSGGTPERVSFRHSWNASERLSNMLLFNLQRHADHHANPTRPYSTLRHREESPQLPTGYPGMLLLAPSAARPCAAPATTSRAAPPGCWWTCSASGPSR